MTKTKKITIVAIGILCILISIILLLPDKGRHAASAAEDTEEPINPISTILYWNNSMIRSATMTDSANNTITFNNKSEQSPELKNGETYIVSFSYYSGSDNITKVICDNPEITVGVPQPNDNTFTFTYRAGGPEPLRFGIITTNTSYDNYITIAYKTTDVTNDVIYLETQDDIMPRILYPAKNYDLYIKPIQTSTPKILDIKVIQNTNYVFINATQTGNGPISDLNRQNATFKQTFSYGSSTYSTAITIETMDISPWTDIAYSQGEKAGYRNGYDQGYETGTTEGYNNGYNKGYGDALAQVEQNPGDFLSLTTAVVDAPVKVITEMMDVEILGFNMKDLAIGLLSAAIIISLIKVFAGR